MSTAASRAWRKAGKPFRVAQPIADLARILRARGYTVGTIGNDAHLNSNTPEDHTPFGVTGWPIAHPYPYVMACDIMPPPAGRGLPNIAQLGAQIVADRKAGYGPVAWLKYINWTNSAGAVRHEAWKPGHVVRSSSDRGHIHLSARTDFANSTAARDYDPVARVLHLVLPAPPSGSETPPPFLRDLEHVAGKALMKGADVRQWQSRMRQRGWTIAVDGQYGPEGVDVCRRFQRDKRLQIDGIVGPVTWRASWEAPIT